MQKLNYDHQAVEEKWQAYWEELQLFQNTQLDLADTEQDLKDYLLFAFAYPSGSGLHVGHVESKTALDILARYKRMNGRKVYFPVGWDAFGLPAENYAIKTGIHPRETTKAAIKTFRRQLKRIGISYDWANESATNHPEYYRWTQWIFLQLFEQGLAYQKEGKVNWCPSCQTVLANEQVVNGLCERCDATVEQRDLKQWYFKISAYRDELIAGLKEVDWPEATKQQQLNWIGRSEGAEVDFKLSLEGIERKLKIFTTRLDTIFGATFMVISPEKFLALQLDQQLAKLASAGQVSQADQQRVLDYVQAALKKTEEVRRIGEKDKTGEDTFLKAINPFNGEELPIYVADYVLAGYGTGAIMAVPAHDERDLAFAEKFNLPVKEVVVAGRLVNSADFDGLTSSEASEALLAKYASVARKTVNYKLRDWLISRQRYWGAPIPIVYDPSGQAHAVKEEHLPWTLPDDVDFKPTGESPLRSSQEFKERVEKLYGPGWTPEYDTMDTFVDSSWYYLRYCDSRNKKQFARQERLDQWLPVDLYLIGPEHIVLHLLYSRFFTKFLRDQGYLTASEPFAKMRHQGMILGPDGKKMSKSKGNVINPDSVVEEFGADTLRIYEMFMGPLEADKPWNTRAVAGVSRFLKKIYRLLSREIELTADLWPVQAEADRSALLAKLHQTIKKVTEDLPALKFNTAIASLMEFSNLWEKQLSALAGQAGQSEAAGQSEGQPEQHWALFSATEILAVIKLLAPLAPFMAEELYGQLKYDWKHLAEQTLGEIKCEAAACRERRQFLETLKFKPSIHLDSWPSYDLDLAKSQGVTIAVQVNGKLRGELNLDPNDPKDSPALSNQANIVAQAKALASVQKWLEGKELKKAIYVPGKIVSLVVA